MLVMFSATVLTVTPVAATNFSLWPSSSPGTGTDAQAVEVGVRFTSDSAGYVTAIRFYKLSNNTGTHIGKLWTSAGVLLGSVTFAGESASGWQQQALSSPILISAGTQYIASYHTTVGNYAFNGNYFTSTVDNPPLHAPTTGNGIFKYGASNVAFSNFATFNASNYWVDLVFSDVLDTTAPTISLTAPVNNTAVSATTTVTASASDNISVSGVQFFLDNVALGSEDTASPYSISWNTTTTSNGSHTLLARARDAAGNAATSTPVTVTVSNDIVPAQGPGGPILIVASVNNPFSTYYKEILLAEGFNMYRMLDISAVTASTLVDYDVVILGEMSLSGAQATMFTDWVTGGGNLIAMRPHSSLASLLGITSQGTTLSDAYFNIDTTTTPGAGIVSSSLQFHGTADRYTLNGATEIAALYSNISTSLGIPAVTNIAVGSANGHAASFAFDLAKSVVYTRQGNPAWSGQDRRIDTAETGSTLIRPMDLFYGNSLSDPQSDWVDFTNIQIPQADEAQRLLANMIHNMLTNQKPLPHFWYLPRGEKAAVVMTGDDHANGGTSGRFDFYVATSTSGCSVADWDCIRSTSYIYANSPLTQGEAVTYVAQDFEVALHPNAGCANPVNLTSSFSTDFAAFASAYTGIPAPRTIRTHCGPWPLYDTHSQIASDNHGIRFDTNYYYWPTSWTQDRPGLFTGSGFPMRFTNASGAIMDAYQAPTQLTDESGQTYPLNVNTLLDNATGANGYYGMFVLNAHTDNASSAVSDAVINSARTRSVPMISAAQALDWVDGRNDSSFGSVAWNAAASTLSFTITQDADARGLTTLIPAVFGGALSTLTRNSVPLAYTTVTVKGISYAQFESDGGTFQAVYLPETTAPSVSVTAPLSGATVSGTASVTATASDNIGVSGVQFRLDGANLGAEDTTSSYSISWDTTAASNGSHTLSAVARDAAGNTATAANVNVTVSNTVAEPVVGSGGPATSNTSSLLSNSNDGSTSVRTVTQGKSLSNTTTTLLTVRKAGKPVFSATGLPPGAEYTYKTTACRPTCILMETITTSPTTPPGTYTITVTGASGPASRQMFFEMIVDPSSAPIPASTPPEIFPVKDRVQTTANLNVRPIPSTSGTLLGTQPIGALGTIVGTSTTASGFRWLRIDYDTGADGWSAEDFLTRTSEAAQDRHGSALSFDGTNSVTIDTADSFDTATSSLTVAAWVFPTKTLSGWRTILIKEQPDNLAYALYANSNTGVPALLVHTGRGEQSVRAKAALPRSTWTYLAGTYDGAAERLYINGILADIRFISGTIATSTSPLRIGGNSLWGEYFQGRIDEVRVYNRALTATEIQSDMNAPVQ